MLQLLLSNALIDQSWAAFFYWWYFYSNLSGKKKKRLKIHNSNREISLRVLTWVISTITCSFPVSWTVQIYHFELKCYSVASTSSGLNLYWLREVHIILPKIQKTQITSQNWKEAAYFSVIQTKAKITFLRCLLSFADEGSPLVGLVAAFKNTNIFLFNHFILIRVCKYGQFFNSWKRWFWCVFLYFFFSISLPVVWAAWQCNILCIRGKTTLIILWHFIF